MKNHLLFVGVLPRVYGIRHIGYIAPAIKYLNIVIPAKAGIQVDTGYRIKSGMTELDYLVARLITSLNSKWKSAK